MRWFIGLCSVVALLSFGAVVARPAAADGVPAVVIPGPESLYPDNEALDIIAKATLKNGFAEEMTKGTKKYAMWRCVVVGGSEEPKIELRFKAQKDPVDKSGKRYVLELSLSVKSRTFEDSLAGLVERTATIDLNKPEYAEQAKTKHPVLILQFWGGVLVDWMMESLRPCAVEAELKTKSTLRHEDQYAIVSGETSMTPVELELTLDENGNFAAEGSTVVQLTSSIAPGSALLALRAVDPPPPPCLFETTLLRGQQSMTLHIAGSYREADDSLKYDSITAEAGTAKVTAAGGCAAGMVPPDMPGMAGDLLGSGERAQPLADGTVLALPKADFLPPEAAWEGSVTLTYEPEVGGTPPPKLPE